jgi:hypothetical protein
LRDNAIDSGCNGITYEGCCLDTKLVYCTGDELLTSECEESCGWNDSAEWYACGAEGKDPSGKYPLTCPEI